MNKQKNKEDEVAAARGVSKTILSLARQVSNIFKCSFEQALEFVWEVLYGEDE